MKTLTILLIIYFFISTNLAGAIIGHVKYNIRSKGFIKGWAFMFFLGPFWALHTFAIVRTRHTMLVSWAIYYFRLITGKFANMSKKDIDKIERDITTRRIPRERVQWEKIKAKYGYNPSRKVRRAMKKI